MSISGSLACSEGSGLKWGAVDAEVEGAARLAEAVVVVVVVVEASSVCSSLEVISCSLSI